MGAARKENDGPEGTNPRAGALKTVCRWTPLIKSPGAALLRRRWGAGGLTLPGLRAPSREEQVASIPAHGSCDKGKGNVLNSLNGTDIIFQFLNRQNFLKSKL